MNWQKLQTLCVSGTYILRKRSRKQGKCNRLQCGNDHDNGDGRCM